MRLLALPTVVVVLLQASSLIAGPTTVRRDNTPPPVELNDGSEHKFETTGRVSTLPVAKSVPGPRPELDLKNAPLGDAVVPKPTEVAATPTKRAETAPRQSSSPTFDEGSARRIKEAIQTYSAIASRAGWQPIPADAKFAEGTAGRHDELLRQRLVVSSDLNQSEASGPYDPELAAGVKRFQIRHGLAPTGIMTLRTLAALNVPVEKRIQQLEASATRIATIGFRFSERYVVVNLPAAYAEAVERDHVVRRYRVIVGKTEKPSPTVTAEISDINLNPTWTVPASITKNEIAAHMRKDASYLRRTHMQLLDAHDASIDPATVDWSVGKTPNVVVRQEPGPWNALGQVRVNMPNSYAVYMHDTNQKTHFSDDYRFESHGCVRVDNVRDLAAWLLHDSPKWGRVEIDAAIAAGQPLDIKLQHKVPVAWIYLTAWMSRDQIVNFRDDIYDQDQQLVEATAEEKSFFDQAEESKVARRAPEDR